MTREIGNVTDESGTPSTPLDSTTDEGRFRLYVLCECERCGGYGKSGMLQGRGDGHMGLERVRCPECRGEGRTRLLVASTDTPEGLGVALVTLGREGEFDECPIGVLDSEGKIGKKWLVKPWLPSARNLSDAGRDLGRRSGQVRRERGRA